PFQRVEYFVQVRKSPARPDVAAQPGVKQGHADLVTLLDHEVGQGRGQVKGVLELRHVLCGQQVPVSLAAVTHGAALVPQQITGCSTPGVLSGEDKSTPCGAWPAAAEESCPAGRRARGLAGCGPRAIRRRATAGSGSVS